MKNIIRLTTTLLVLMSKPLQSMEFFYDIIGSPQKEPLKETIEKTNYPKHILIDLSTLYQPNETIAGNKISSLAYKSFDVSLSTLVFGLKTLSSYISFAVGEEEKKTLFTFLENIKIPSNAFPTSDEIVHTYNNDGKKRALPMIFSTFFLLQSEEQEEQLRTFIKNELEKINYDSCLKKVLLASIDVMFNSTEINDIMELNTNMYSIADALKQAGHTLILTGNIPTHAYKNFMKLTKSDPLKKLFNEKNCFISGTLQLLTSQKKFYQTILKACSTEGNNCIVINERKSKMLTAFCLGATLIKFKHFSKEEKTLDEFNEELKNALISTKKTIE